MANVYMGTDVEEFIFGEGTTYEVEEVETPVEEGAEETPEVVEEEVEVSDEELNAFGVIECVDEPEVACYRIALENEQNYNKIMNAFMMKEFSVLESTGEEMVYEAVDVKKFFDLVKETVARWWSKIQGVIKKVMETISEKTDMNKAFVKKYKDKDIKVPSKDKKFVGYNFDNMKAPEFEKVADIVSKTAGSFANIADFNLEEFKVKADAAKNQMRGAACGKDSVSAEDFDKELKLALFGSEEKVDLNLKTFATLLSDIESAKDVKNAAKDAYKKAQNTVKKLLGEIKKAESEMKKASESKDEKKDVMKQGRALSDTINASLSIMSKAMSVYTKAMFTSLNQDRAMAFFYIANQPKPEKKEKTNESAIDDLDVQLV